MDGLIGDVVIGRANGGEDFEDANKRMEGFKVQGEDEVLGKESNNREAF